MQVGRSKAPSLPIKALSFCRPTDTAGERWCCKAPKGGEKPPEVANYRNAYFAYDTESKSRNAGFKNCGAAATITLSPLGLSPPVGTQPAAIRRPQPSGRSPVNPHTVGVSKDISTNPRLIRLPRLSDYMTREAKRPGEGSFQFPRCTIHGSGEERLGAFMNFSSPARRKLHKNS